MDLEIHLHRLRGILASATFLNADESAEVGHLIEHGEGAEAMRTLAWIIAQKKKSVPRRLVMEIKALTDEWIAPRDMPSSLDEFICD